MRAAGSNHASTPSCGTEIDRIDRNRKRRVAVAGRSTTPHPSPDHLLSGNVSPVECVRFAIEHRQLPSEGGTTLHDSDVDDAEYLRALDAYLGFCYERRSAARVTEFAASIAKSASYLARKFRQVFGRTVLDVMRERQIEHAENLLRTTSTPIQDLALDAAFGTKATFHRVYSSLRGMTPEDYRAQFTK